MSQQRTASTPLDETPDDVKQLGLWAAIASLSYVFWVCGAMEMVERLAFYGVRAVATLYATRPASTGGLGVTMATFGTLLLFWNLVQSLIPMFTGGLSRPVRLQADYLRLDGHQVAGLPGHGVVSQLLGLFRGSDAAGHRHGDLQAGRSGHPHQSHQPPQQLDGLGIFYQTVNIGGWIGPLIALQMRLVAWKYVFYFNAGVICCNFLLLLTYREPGRAERLARHSACARAPRSSPAWRWKLWPN